MMNLVDPDPKMDTEWKAKWVEALRSGDYEQGKNMLRDRENGFCCLGVLCDVSGLGEWRETSKGSSTVWVYAYRGELGAGVPTASMDEAFGLVDYVVEAYGRETSLPELNDEGLSFAEIADIIEEQL